MWEQILSEREEAAAKEATKEVARAMAIEMIKDKLALEKIAKYTKLTIEQVQAIGKKEALL